MNCQPLWVRLVYNWLLNSQTCLLCDEHAGPELALCVACELELPWLGDRCQRCALPLPMAGLVCGQCIRQPPAFERVHAPWVYGFPIDSLIVRFKHHSKWPYGRLLAEILGRIAIFFYKINRDFFGLSDVYQSLVLVYKHKYLLSKKQKFLKLSTKYAQKSFDLSLNKKILFLSILGKVPEGR